VHGDSGPHALLPILFSRFFLAYLFCWKVNPSGGNWGEKKKKSSSFIFFGTSKRLPLAADVAMVGYTELRANHPCFIIVAPRFFFQFLARSTTSVLPTASFSTQIQLDTIMMIKLPFQSFFAGLLY